jgi:hypothetical protein
MLYVSNIHLPYKAKGKEITQMYYARQDITAEMEYVSIRKSDERGVGQKVI